MVELTLRSPHPYALRELVTGALANETRLLQAGIQRTQERLAAFEAQHQMSTTEFLLRYANDELDEQLDLIDWLGEARLLARLQEKLAVIQDIRIEN
jgi:phage shock protein A